MNATWATKSVRWEPLGFPQSLICLLPAVPRAPETAAGCLCVGCGSPARIVPQA